MADIRSVQVLAAPGAANSTENASVGRQRAQDTEEENRRIADARAAAFTAKFGNLRLVSGEEAAAIENLDLNAIRDIRFARETAEALVSLQEIEDNGGEPAATDTENAETQPASAERDSAEGAATDADVTVHATASTAALNVAPPTEGSTEIDIEDASDGSDVEDAAPEATGGGGASFERGAVLDMVV